uniref:hypothetical protein n=1 Tax=Mycobacterium marinum TaxID=1781 RepID=UPI0035633B10
MKAAEAARLQERAAQHQSEAEATRTQLDEQWQRAEDLAPEAGAQSSQTASQSDAVDTGSSR